MPPANDDRTVPQLIALALQGEEDDEQAWEAIRCLHARADQETWDAAVVLLRSSMAKERARGVDVIAQLGTAGPESRSPELKERCTAQLLACLEVEGDEGVLSSLGSGFAHLRDPRAVSALLPLAAHDSPAVRLGVVVALSGHDVPGAIEALVRLSADGEEEVRNWATFALGSMTDVDGPALREALVQRLSELNGEIRGEALVGLARRKDPRVTEALKRELNRRPVIILAVEAAEELGDVALLPLLEVLCDAPGKGSSSFQRAVESAVQRLRQTLQ